MTFLATVLFVVVISPFSLQFKDGSCHEQCGKEEGIKQATKNGELTCFKHESGRVDTSTPCLIKCLGFKAEEDQAACFCGYCDFERPEGETIMKGFCEAPGQPSIAVADCKEKVCGGKAKRYRDECA